MDQSKWALPRNRLMQSSKEAQTLIRPRVKIHGVWLHGVSLNLYCVHPNVPADSSLVAECFMLALQDAVGIFERHQKTLPQECFIWVTKLQVHVYKELMLLPAASEFAYRSNCTSNSQADNTVRETKNSTSIKLMASLLQKQKMTVCGLLFPRVGHSHGSLGFLT